MISDYVLSNINRHFENSIQPLLAPAHPAKNPHPRPQLTKQLIR